MVDMSYEQVHGVGSRLLSGPLFYWWFIGGGSWLARLLIAAATKTEKWSGCQRYYFRDVVRLAFASVLAAWSEPIRFSYWPICDICCRMVYSVTWVYLGTSGSLLSALLLHTSVNTFELFMTGVDPAHTEGPFLAYGVASALQALVVVVMNRQMTQGPA